MISKPHTTYDSRKFQMFWISQFSEQLNEGFVFFYHGFPQLVFSSLGFPNEIGSMLNWFECSLFFFCYPGDCVLILLHIHWNSGRALEDLRASLFNDLRSSEGAKRQQQRICGPGVALTFNFLVAVGIILTNKLVGKFPFLTFFSLYWF